MLLGLIVGQATGYSIDGWVGILVAFFVLRAGWEAAKDTIDPLLGQAPDPELVKGIRETVLAHPEISGVHDLVVHDYGPGHRMVSLHAEVDINGDMAVTHDVIDNVEKELAGRYRVIATIHMDPLAIHDAHVNEVKEQVAGLARQLHEGTTIHDFRMTEGPTHTNLIFDLVLPRSCPLSEEEARRDIYKDVIQKIAEDFELIVTCEEHNIVAGFGSAVAEVIVEMKIRKASLLRIGIKDEYSICVGNQKYLRQHCGINAESIVDKIKEVFN